MPPYTCRNETFFMSLLYLCYFSAKEVYVLAKGCYAEGMVMLAHKNHVTNAQRSCSIRYSLCYNSISFSWVDYSSCAAWSGIHSLWWL